MKLSATVCMGLNLPASIEQNGLRFGRKHKALLLERHFTKELVLGLDDVVPIGDVEGYMRLTENGERMLAGLVADIRQEFLAHPDMAIFQGWVAHSLRVYNFTWDLPIARIDGMEDRTPDLEGEKAYWVLGAPGSRQGE